MIEKKLSNGATFWLAQLLSLNLRLEGHLEELNLFLFIKSTSEEWTGLMTIKPILD